MKKKVYVFLFMMFLPFILTAQKVPLNNQSIEFITALRRLDKPAWLLSYNDEAHNLLKRPNKKDISIRKMQFFDHYLKGAAMPFWMKYGISQTEKGRIDGYNLIK